MSEAGIAKLAAYVARADGGAGSGKGVWPQNVPAVRAFLAACSQWRIVTLPTRHGMQPIFVGLDYAGARAGIEAAGITITPDLWAGVMVMETAAAKELNREFAK